MGLYACDRLSHRLLSNLKSIFGQWFISLKKNLGKTGQSRFGHRHWGRDVLQSAANLNEAYKVQQLQGDKLSAFESLYHATLGGAKALSLDDKLGNFNLGKEADFVVLDLKATALQALRQQRAKGIEDALFALMTMGDDRNIHATYIFGQKAYVQN